MARATHEHHHIEVRRDVVYGRTAEKDLLANVYRPPGDGPFPAVVYIHGGAWQRGDRGDYADHRLIPVAAQGIIVVSVSYRFSTEATWPAQAFDGAQALRWAGSQARELGIDPARLGAWGASAGGHIVSILAMVQGRTAFGSTDPFPPVHSAVAFFTPSDLTTLATDPREADAALPSFAVGRASDPVRPEEVLVGTPETSALRGRLLEASPIAHVSGSSAPLLMVHGTRDAMVPLAQPRRMARALAAAGVQHQLLLVDGATHEDQAFHTTAVLGAVAGWLTAP